MNITNNKYENNEFVEYIIPSDNGSWRVDHAQDT